MFINVLIRCLSLNYVFFVLPDELEIYIFGLKLGLLLKSGVEQKSIEKPERGPIFGTEAHYSSLEAVLFLLFHLHTFIKEH